MEIRREKPETLQHHNCGRTSSGLREGNVESRDRSSGRSRMKEQIVKTTAAALPRGIRGEALELLGKHIDKNRARPLKLIKAAAGTIGWGYRQQLKASFSH